jgi:hypothetical protein
VRHVLEREPPLDRDRLSLHSSPCALKPTLTAVRTTMELVAVRRVAGAAFSVPTLLTWPSSWTLARKVDKHNVSASQLVTEHCAD